MADESGGVPGWAPAAQPESPLDVTFSGDGGFLDHVRNTNAGPCNPGIEKERSGNNPDSARLGGGQAQIDSSPVLIACLPPAI